MPAREALPSVSSGGEAEHDRGEGAADGQGGGRDPGDPQRQDHDRGHREEADQEAQGAGRRRVDAAEEARRDPAHQPVAAGRADDDQDHHGRRADPRSVAWEAGRGAGSRRPAPPSSAIRASRSPPSARPGACWLQLCGRGPLPARSGCRVSNSSRFNLRRGAGIGRIGPPRVGGRRASSGYPRGASRKRPFCPKGPRVAFGLGRDGYARGARGTGSPAGRRSD